MKVVLASFLVVQCVAAGSDSELLKLGLYPVPPMPEKVELTTALSDLGPLVRGGYVLFGVEVRVSDSGGPLVKIDPNHCGTLGDAVRQILVGAPDYRYDFASRHLINIFPAGAKQDPRDVMNTRVARFDVVDAQPDEILQHPGDFIPELKTRLMAGVGQQYPTNNLEWLRSAGPTISLHLRNVTVRDILNAVTEATEQFPANYSPMGWAYSFQSNPSLPGGGIHTWSWLWSAPHDWKNQSEK
jgi:hypothetical protein